MGQNTIGMVSNYFHNNKIAVFSDLHIGVHRNSKSWHTIATQWASWIVDELKAHNIRDVMFCGDYFHTRDEVSVDTLHFGATLLEMFSDFKVTMIVGNHDCYLRDSSVINSIAPFKHWSNINIIDKTTYITSHGRVMALVPWGDEATDTIVDAIFGHFEINHFKMNTFRVCDHGIDATSLTKKAPLIVSGHFHLRDEKRYGAATVLYVGNPFEMDFNDAGSTKGYYIMDVVDNTYTFYVNNITPKHINIRLSELVVNDDVVHQIAGNFVRVKMDLHIVPQDVETITTYLNSFTPREMKIEYTDAAASQQLQGFEHDMSGVDIEQAIIEFVGMLKHSNADQIIKHTLDIYNQIKQ